MARGLIDGDACVSQTWGLAEFDAAPDRTPAPGRLQTQRLFPPSMLRLAAVMQTHVAQRARQRPTA